MKILLRTYLLPAILTMLALGAWAAVIAVALRVSTVVLDTLQMIVDLAAMS